MKNGCQDLDVGGAARELLARKPAIDRNETLRVANELFPNEKLLPLSDVSLDFTCPPDDELHIACFPGLTVIAAKEFAIDKPSQLNRRFLSFAGSKHVHLHAMHSVVDWFAMAVWSDGALGRSLSLAPDSGVVEDLGERLPFEQAYWPGQHPAIDPEDADPEDPAYPFAFHPLELGEEALKHFFGYQLEGYIDPSLLAPETIPLMRFRRKKPWYRFW